jgi:hypothetical protein
MSLNFRHLALLILKTASVTTCIAQAGCGPSKPKIIPTPAAIEETKADPQEAAAARKIQFWQRRQRVLHRISAECHEILNSEPVANAAGTHYDFELLAAEKFLEQTETAWDKTYQKDGLAEDYVSFCDTQEHGRVKRAWERPSQKQIASLTNQPAHRLQSESLVLARLDCLRILHSQCALNREKGQIERNNPKYILRKLYLHGLPRLKQSDNHK